MARTIQQIYTQITTELVAQYAAIGITIDPNQWSKYSPRRLLIFVFATCWWTVEVLFDEHNTVVDDKIANQKAHTFQWYATKAKAFRYGQALIPDTDQYDDTGLTPEAIEAMQVVKFSAAVPAPKGIRIKVATIGGSGDLEPLPALQYDAFKAYMNEVKDAGVSLNPYFTNAAADSLLLSLRIYYNALVLSADGKRLDGTNDTPVQDAIDTFLKSGMPFNGLFIVARLIDAIQQVDGVIIPHVLDCQATYGAVPYSPVPVEYQPDAGYLRLLDPSDLTLEFVAHAVL